MADQEIYLYSTNSPPQSIDTGAGYFPQAPGITLSDGTILYTWRDDSYGSSSSGTGLFDPFLTLQPTKTTTESGTNFYSGGSYGTGDALSSGDSRTSSIKANLIPVVGFGGLEYYEIRLDVNEVNSAQKGLIDLNSFKVFGSNSATQGNGGGTLLYSLDTASINTTIHIFDDSTGSGKSDVVMLIPKSYFNSNPEYLYFEASLSGADGGFEEFSVRVLEIDPPIPDLTITKVASLSTVDAVNEVINYTITVANAGNVTLTSVVLTDEFAKDYAYSSGDTDADQQLDVAESWIYTASHKVTQDEMDEGLALVNTATVDTDQTAPEQASATTTIRQAPDLTITKVASLSTVDAVNEVINYTITVANAGNVTLTSVVLTDEFAKDYAYSSGDTDADQQLDVAESWIYTASHKVTQDEMDEGLALVNTATVDTDQTAPEQASATTTIRQAPDLTITKVASLSTVDAVNEVINYTITVANAGNVTLTSVVLTDEFAKDYAYSSGDTDADQQLDVAESWIYTASHKVTQDEMDEGLALVNTATVDTDQTAPEQASATTTIRQAPDLTITKVASLSTVDAVNEVINYTITVANAGNVTLTSVVLTDEFAKDYAYSSGDTDADQQLDVAESWIYTASHKVTQDEMDEGLALVNTATVDTDQTAPEQASATTTIRQAPDLTITKVASLSTVDAVNEVINYTITVANAGNVTLTSVVLTDEFAKDYAYSSGDTDTDQQLDVGESWIYTASHTVNQDEMDDGLALVNTATVDTDQTAPEQASATTTIRQAPDLTITKVANVDFVDEAGDTILYTITVENEGNITLNGVDVFDLMLTGSLTNDWNHDSMIDGDANNNGALDVGEAWVWTGEYIVTQADIDAARATSDPYTINNTAYADSDQTGMEEASETVGVKVDFEGLSHGYWKTHSSDWDVVTTGTSFENFFFGSQQTGLKWQVSTGAKPNKFATVNDVTFDQALALTGGDKAALAREAVASILNIHDEDVTYRFTESQVKEWVSEALSNQAVDINNDGINEFAAGADAITGVKNLLEFNNNLELV